MSEKDVFCVNGYRFNSMADVRQAELDLKKAAYFRDKLKGQNPRNMLIIYHKLLEEKIFATPVGWAYLKELQEYLTDAGIDPERIRPVTLNQSFEKQEPGTLNGPGREREKNLHEKTRRTLRLSLCFNVILGILVAAMFGIAMASDNPNILNYKRVITNQYAAWEEELTQREAVVREKEGELNISQN